MKKIALFISILTLAAFLFLNRQSQPTNESLGAHIQSKPTSAWPAAVVGTSAKPVADSESVASTAAPAPVTFRATLKDFAANQFKVEGIEANRKRVESLASQDEAVALASKALVETDWTRREFGGDQAAGRVLAIRVLSARARQGDLRPLRETAISLGSSFLSLDGGQKADLRDLVTEWIAAVGAEDFYNDPSLVLRHFKNASEVRKLVIAASVAHLGHDINNPDFIARMKLWR